MLSIGTAMSTDDLGRRCPELPDIVADAIASEKGLRAMTMKEKLAMHRRIEAENKRKLAEWKSKQKKSA